jgi:hypothetical protein
MSITGLDEATAYSLAGRKIPQESVKSADASATASIPDSPDISLNDVLHS